MGEDKRVEGVFRTNNQAVQEAIRWFADEKSTVVEEVQPESRAKAHEGS